MIILKQSELIRMIQQNFFAKRFSSYLNIFLSNSNKQMSKVLIIVDVQNDFCQGGSLAVTGSNQIFPIINTLKKHHQFKAVVLTQDWHPQNHVSFASTHQLQAFTYILINEKKQQLWPDHCIAGTHGSELSPLLQVSQTDYIVRKGIYKEIDSYSGFFNDGKHIQLKQKLQEFGIKQILVCGLAFDFCVGSTALDAKALGYDVTVIKEATRSVAFDTQKKMQKRLDQLNIKVISINEFYNK